MSGEAKEAARVRRGESGRDGKDEWRRWWRQESWHRERKFLKVVESVGQGSDKGCRVPVYR